MVGAWRSRIHATSGALASLDNLQFMYAFNAGGTMTESSNYDGAPPVPPAYGVWRWTAPQTFEVRYAFFTAKPPATFEAIAKGGGWSPDGYGILTEEISLADDGQSFDSSLSYRLFNADGKPINGGGEAHGSGVRIGF
jgi:hypothetical protein